MKIIKQYKIFLKIEFKKVSINFFEINNRAFIKHYKLLFKF